MGSVLTHILPFVLPPVLGAIIGYLTNDIAIKMLFRPLTEKRLFGVRIPFTPGIIPRQRYQLAESIGRMVSTQLLTSDTVRAHVETEGFRAGIRKQIAAFTEGLLNSKPVATESDDARLVGEGVQEALSGIFASFLRSDNFERVTVEFVRRGFQLLANLSIGDVLPKNMKDPNGSLEMIEAFVDRIVGARLSESLVETGVNWIREQLEKNTPVGNYLSNESIARLTLVLSRAYGPLTRYAIDWLQGPNVREELTTRGKALLRGILERLNFFQRLLVSAGQYERTLSERMPAIIDDLIRSLQEAAESPDNKARILDGISEWMQRLQRRGLREVCQEAGVDLEVVSRRLLGSVTSLLVGDAGRKRIARMVNGYLHAHLDARIVDILSDVFLLDSPKIEGWLSQGLKRLREKPEASAGATSFINTILSTLLTEIRNRPLRETILLTDSQKSKVDDFITDRISGIINEKLPDIVDTFDIHRMVVDKINGLDIEAVEQLLLMVIAKQLKWINLFGAVLGAIIGGGQVLIGLFT